MSANLEVNSNSASLSLSHTAALTGTTVTVSRTEDLYPGTSLRWVQVVGRLDPVRAALAVLWELVGLEREDPRCVFDWLFSALINHAGTLSNYLCSLSGIARPGVWVPVDRPSGRADGVRVEARLVVPASAVGSIIGEKVRVRIFLSAYV